MKEVKKPNFGRRKETRVTIRAHRVNIVIDDRLDEIDQSLDIQQFKIYNRFKLSLENYLNFFKLQNYLGMHFI